MPFASAVADLLKHPPITVYGDYDVDGVTGTAILARTLRRCGVPYNTCTPHRTLDGYGLHEHSVRRLHRLGTRSLITVDCGAASRDAISLARSLGMLTVVTDHHNAGKTPSLPDHLIHCKERPFGDNPHLCGSATAWKLSLALLSHFDLPPDPDDELLAALGTVADVVPLIGENHALVKRAMPRLRNTSLAALSHLLGLSRARRCDAETVAFQLAPRINACGRLGCASSAVEMLTTQDYERACKLASYCDRLNAQRKLVEKEITAEVMLEADLLDDGGPVVASGTWHPGVVGIVASKVVEKTGRPAVILNRHGKYASGSCRAPAGYDLHALLAACSSSLVSYGGHAAAAGLKLEFSRQAQFRAMFHEAVAAAGPPVLPPPEMPRPLTLQGLNKTLFEELERRSPFGCGNPEPVFTLSCHLTSSPRRIGGDKTHLMFSLGDSLRSHKAFAFFLAHREVELRVGKRYNWQIKVPPDGDGLKVVDWHGEK